MKRGHQESAFQEQKLRVTFFQGETFWFAARGRCYVHTLGALGFLLPFPAEFCGIARGPCSRLTSARSRPGKGKTSASGVVAGLLFFNDYMTLKPVYGPYLYCDLDST